MRRSLLPLVLGGVAFATVFAGLGQREAHAARYYVARAEPYGPRGDNGVTLDVDGDLLLPVGNDIAGKNPFNTGFGVDARLGFRASSRFLFVQPELYGGLTEFEFANAYSGAITSASSVGRFMAGARLGGRGIFEPQVFAHIGYAGGGFGLNGFTYDIGGAANLRFRRVTFGLQAGFNQIVGSTIVNKAGNKVGDLSVKWINVGPNVGVIF